MKYRRLGKTGLQVSELSFGSWVTFGTTLDLDLAKECMRFAYERGVNFFDNAEVYGHGAAELLMGEALREFPREKVIVSTKIFWGGEGPNQTGLSWKRMVEGTKNSLRRLQQDYVDILFCHRPDTETPIEETMRAIETLVQQGLVFYWGTSEWEATQIEEAMKLASLHHLTPPVVEQPEYNLLERKKLETDYLPLFKNYGLGTTIWSPLASGFLTGKYQKGIPEKSRLSHQQWLLEYFTEEKKRRIDKYISIVEKSPYSPSEVGIAWCLRNPNVSTVILGASNLQQLEQNLAAGEIELDEALVKEIEAI